MAKYKLGDIAPIQQGSVPESESYWLLNLDMVESNTGHIYERLYVPFDKIGTSTIAFDTNNVLYSKLRPYLNKVVIPDCPGYATSEMLPLKPNKNYITREYLTYFLRSPKFVAYINEKTSGAKMPRANSSDLKSVEIECPTLENQRHITSEFDRIISIVRLRQQQLQKLDELVKARFVELFGDCILNTKGWKTKRLGDIAEVGSSKRVFVEDLKENGIPFYRGTEIGALAEKKSVAPELFISEEHYSKLCKATGSPQIGDLLMPSICPDGRIWIVNTSEPFYFKDGRVLWVHAIVNSYNPIFLLYTLKDRIMTDYSSIASGTTFAELKIFALKECQIFDVPLELQNQFAAFVEQTDKSKVAVQKALDEAQLLFDSLMQKYFG